jgi:hypothetical protein
MLCRIHFGRVTTTGLHRERNDAIFKVCAPKRGAREGLAAFNEIVKWKGGIISKVPATSRSIYVDW